MKGLIVYERISIRRIKLPLYKTIQDTHDWLNIEEEMMLSKLKVGLSKEKELEVIAAWRSS
ncbi:hypothetical protein DH09_13110 [Bacillaceae bacterium JMAK1]|nr:hypothetical protein DH09_13110 [Bacillaceae bacterium JMAK1]